MNTGPTHKTIVIAYLSSGWKPSAIYLLVLVLFTITQILHWSWMTLVGNFAFLCLGAAFCGMIVAAIWNLLKKRWAAGLANLGLFVLCMFVSSVAMGVLMFESMAGPSEDGFAGDLTIPSDIEVAEPLSELTASESEVDDPFQQRLLRALATPGNDDPTITADVDAVMRLQKQAPDVFKRFLAASPCWRVFKEHGNMFATRRWKIGGTWHYNLHGYYLKHDLDTWSWADIPNFQTRLTIGFSGKPWASWDATRMDAGQTRALKLSKGNRMHESRCIIKADGIIVEVFEQSEARERRLTKASLSHLEQELSPLARHPGWETICSLLPDGSITNGDPAFNLRNSFQPGIYLSEIWLNPGEPGMIYLKAFEVTRETPLSAGRLKERSNQHFIL